DGFVAIRGTTLVLRDAELTQTAVIALPLLPPHSGYGCSGVGGLRLSMDRAIVGMGCARIVEIDLTSRAVARVIDDARPFATVDVVAGLLFVAAPQEWGGITRVFELDSGRELARLDVPADMLKARGDRILAMQRNEMGLRPNPTPTHVTVFEPD